MAANLLTLRESVVVPRITTDRLSCAKGGEASSGKCREMCRREAASFEIERSCMRAWARAATPGPGTRAEDYCRRRGLFARRRGREGVVGESDGGDVVAG